MNFIMRLFLLHVFLKLLSNLVLLRIIRIFFYCFYDYTLFDNELFCIFFTKSCVGRDFISYLQLVHDFLKNQRIFFKLRMITQIAPNHENRSILEYNFVIFALLSQIYIIYCVKITYSSISEVFTIQLINIAVKVVL